MYARKRIVRVPVDPDETLRSRLCAAVQIESGTTVDEDAHLVEAAIVTDRSIASCDEKARKVFAEASGRVGEIGTIVWVNPTTEAEAPVSWLQAGAPAESHRHLANG